MHISVKKTNLVQLESGVIMNLYFCLFKLQGCEGLRGPQAAGAFPRSLLRDLILFPGRAGGSWMDVRSLEGS